MPVGDPRRLVAVGDRSEMPRHGADAGTDREFLRFDLVAHRLDGGGRRADEDDAGRFERPGEGGVLRKEAVARMHRIGAGLPARVEDALDAQIALARGRRPDLNRLVGDPDMQRAAIGLRIDGDCGDSEPLRRAHDPDGDLAAIRDENFPEHPFPPAACL